MSEDKTYDLIYVLNQQVNYSKQLRYVKPVAIQNMGQVQNDGHEESSEEHAQINITTEEVLQVVFNWTTERHGR